MNTFDNVLLRGVLGNAQALTDFALGKALDDVQSQRVAPPAGKVAHGIDKLLKLLAVGHLLLRTRIVRHSSDPIDIFNGADGYDLGAP